MYVLAEFVMMTAGSVGAGVTAFVLLAVIVAMGMLQTDAVFLLSRAIVEGMQQALLNKEGQGTKDRAAVHSGQQAFEVCHREGIVEVLEGFPDHDTYGSRSYVMIV